MIEYEFGSDNWAEQENARLDALLQSLRARGGQQNGSTIPTMGQSISTKKIYLIGSLRNPEVPVIAADLRREGYQVYDDWFAAGPEADDYWKEYSQARKQTFPEALQNWAAFHTHANDKQHLDESDTGVLLMPAGKSGHLELGYLIGQGKRGYILLDRTNDRWDVMYKFAAGVFYTVEDLIQELKGGDTNG